MKYLKLTIIVICSILFFMIGSDKFFSFLEPPCSLENQIPSTIWKMLGVLQIISGILIWSSKYRKYVTGFFGVFMVIFMLVHWLNNTYDIGGALSMAVLLALLYFLDRREKSAFN